jgi:hypothetical protein
MFLALFLLALTGAAIAAIGWHFGWFTVSSHRGESKPNLTVSIDTQKISADKEKVLNKIKPASNPDRD